MDLLQRTNAAHLEDFVPLKVLAIERCIYAYLCNGDTCSKFGSV